MLHLPAVVSRGQTTIFAQGRYRFQYKRPANMALILQAITPLREQGPAIRDYTSCIQCCYMTARLSRAVMWQMHGAYCNHVPLNNFCKALIISSHGAQQWSHRGRRTAHWTRRIAHRDLAQRDRYIEPPQYHV